MADKTKGQEKSWKWLCKLAKVLKCLPSAYADDNDHIITAAEKLQSRIAELELTLQDMLKRFGCKTDLNAQKIVGDYAHEARVLIARISTLEAELAEREAQIKIVKVGDLETVPYSNTNFITGKPLLDLTPQVVYEMGVQAGILECGEILSKPIHLPAKKPNPAFNKNPVSGLSLKLYPCGGNKSNLPEAKEQKK